MTSLIASLIISQELSDQLQLCPGGASDPSAFLNVGSDMELACEVQARLELALSTSLEPTTVPPQHVSAHHGASLSPQVRYLRSAKLTIIVKSSDGTPSQVSATDDLDCH